MRSSEQQVAGSAAMPHLPLPALQLDFFEPCVCSDPTRAAAWFHQLAYTQ